MAYYTHIALITLHLYGKNTPICSLYELKNILLQKITSMNIAFFHEYFPKGGAERVTLDISEFLMKNGFNIYLFARKYEEEKLPVDSSFKNKVKVFVLPDSKDSNSTENAEYIAKTTEDNNIEILIIQAYTLGTIQLIKKENPKIKVVFCNHGVPFWEVNDKIERKKNRAKTSIGKKIEYYLFDIHKIYTLKTYKHRFEKAYKKLYASVDAYVTLCNGYSEEIEKRLKLNNTEKLFAINNAEKPVENIVMDKKNTVVFVGRLSYADKRADRLIKIWDMLGEATDGWILKIVGDGPEKSNLEALAAKLKIKNIEFVGFCNNTKQIYDEASILCMTSEFEGWGLVLTEAQANGVIPMAFGCSAGVREILSPNNKNGIIIEPGDMKGYARKLKELIENKELRKQMQLNVIEKSKEYSPEVVGQNWIKLINTLTGRK